MFGFFRTFATPLKRFIDLAATRGVAAIPSGMDWRRFQPCLISKMTSVRVRLPLQMVKVEPASITLTINKNNCLEAVYTNPFVEEAGRWE